MKRKLNKNFFRNVLAGQFIWLAAFVLCSAPLLHAGEKLINPKNVLGVVTSDWNNDGSFDRAVLALSESDHSETELFIYLSNPSRSDLGLTVHKKNIAWTASLAGTLPALETNRKGSLIITSANDSIGRDRWTQKLTIVYQNNRFVVAGYTCVAHDTLNPEYKFNCDVNLLTGRGEKNGKSFTSSAKAVNILDWSEASIPEACQQQ